MVRPDPHDGDRLRRITDLPEHRQVRHGPEHVEVADQPVLLEPVIVHVRRQGTPQEAASAVRADHVASANLDLLAVRPVAVQRDGLLVLLDPGHRHALVDVDAGQGLVMPVEHRLDLRLEHHVHRGPAGRSAIGVAKVDQGLAGRVDPLVVALGHDAVADLVHDAEPLEQPHGLVVEAGGARQVVEAAIALQHHEGAYGRTGQEELPGSSRSDRIQPGRYRSPSWLPSLRCGVASRFRQAHRLRQARRHPA